MDQTKKILMSHSILETIKVLPSQEPFVNLVNFDPSIVVDQTLSHRTKYFSYVRLSVAKKLTLAKNYLPSNLRFYIKEGYRPLHLQELAFERSLQRVKKSNRYLELKDIIEEASKYVAPPNVAPHPTGGAVDLSLINSTGTELDLGTPFDAIPEETNYATYFEAKNISEMARNNRQILAHALQSVGFVNYYTEWWHWSYGDKYWAIMTNTDYALFDSISEKELAYLIAREEY